VQAIVLVWPWRFNRHRGSVVCTAIVEPDGCHTRGSRK
jgi:hypothetical protein